MALVTYHNYAINSATCEAKLLYHSGLLYQVQRDMQLFLSTNLEKKNDPH